MAAQGFTSAHWSDGDGNPAGGSTFGVGFSISWQNGPLGTADERREPNGAFVEDVIAAARDRIAYYQGGKFRCDENQVALDLLGSAIEALNMRTSRREAAGIEGTHAEDSTLFKAKGG